jgi:carbamoyltransferase
MPVFDRFHGEKKKMNILGISCFYHDSAACVVKDGVVAAASQEERFNREKYSQDFPIRAINDCLQRSGMTIYDVDHIAFYEKPMLKFQRVLLSHLRSFPMSLGNFIHMMPGWFQDRLVLPLKIQKELGYKGDIFFLKHHMSHAASAFLVSPFQEAGILTVDGVGEWATATKGYGRGTEIKIGKEINYPDSLGLLYSIVTTFLGFRVFSGEGKVMGLSAYGKPLYLDKFRKIVDVRSDGSFHMAPRFFSLNKGNRMYSRNFIKEFGPPRLPDENISQRHMDIAASLQAFLEEVVIAMARALYKEIRSPNLCLAGGVFLNCVANHRLLAETPFKNIFVQPAAGDSGCALGAAIYTYNCLLGNPRKYVMETVALGPEFGNLDIERALVNRGLRFRKMRPEEMFKHVALRISEKKIVGWFQGKMEFGPRALGMRSILADPRFADIKEILNVKVKFREWFRPFAPSVMEEHAAEYFDLESKSPFMLLAAAVRKEKRGIIPGVTHVDGTARIQTVSRATNGRYWDLINEFKNITGVPMLVNTSFNLRGEPIVCTPDEAIVCFQKSAIDCLVLNDFVSEKGEDDG